MSYASASIIAAATTTLTTDLKSRIPCFSDLNLLDWSNTNLLAVSLGGSVYLWNASTGEITQLLQMEGPEEYVGAVSWIKEGNYLAVGTRSGEVQVLNHFLWMISDMV